MKFRKAAVALAVVTAGLTLGACSSDSSSSTTTTTTMAPEAATQSIVEIASGNPDFSTLVTAVKAAGLVDTLSGPGPYTVFAPTNAAFAALPAGTVETLLMPENKATLAKILTYHVVAGKNMAADIMPGTLTTAEGGTITVSTENGKVILTDGKGGKATVTKTDIEASNGVIHVIDAVLQPAS
ncbi:MAG: fasciclin domain-containing protein [Acidimicrobiales bacterium]